MIVNFEHISQYSGAFIVYFEQEPAGWLAKNSVIQHQQSDFTMALKAGDINLN